MASVFVAPLAVEAQERAAGSAMEAQMNWSSLSNMIKSSDTKVNALDSLVKQIILCNKKIKLYAPGEDGADADGCLEMPFPMETEYVESAGWVSTPYTLACTKGRTITYAMLNVTTKSNQLACGQSGANCDGNATSSLKGKPSWTITPDPGKYVSAYIECKKVVK